MAKKKQKVKIECQECDSVYKVEFEFGLTSENVPQYCSFCGAELDLEDNDEDEYEDEE